MKLISTLVLTLTMLAAFACSEAVDTSSSMKTTVLSAEGSDDAADSKDAGKTSSSKGTSKSDASTPRVELDGAVAQVVINEMSGQGEWVEIMNAGTAAADIGDFGITDHDADTNGPNLSHTVHFPKGTVLSPNAYVVVVGLASGVAPDAGLCPSGGWSYCFFGEFGISDKKGETMYLLDPSDAIATEVAYPANTVSDTAAWGRVPNGTGTFRAVVPTPGDANQAPK